MRPCVLLALTACGPPFIERSVQVRFDPGSTDPWALPFPTDLRSSDERALAGTAAQLTGAIDPATLPASAAASIGPDATVFLLDPNAVRVPVEVSFAPGGDVPNLLAAAPVSPLDPGTYALVVTDGIRTERRERLGRSRAFHDAFEETGDAARETVLHLRVMRARLAAEAFGFGRVAGGTVFSPNGGL